MIAFIIAVIVIIQLKQKNGHLDVINAQIHLMGLKIAITNTMHVLKRIKLRLLMYLREN